MNCLIYSALSHFEKLYVSITYFCQTLKALKNIFVSFIAFCILGFSGGVNIVKHYCGETLKEVSVNKEAVSCCDKHEPISQSDLMNETCCLDQVSFFKTFEFEKQTIPLKLVALTTTAIEKPSFILEKPRSLLIENNSLPPPKLAIYKQVQHFLI